MTIPQDLASTLTGDAAFVIQDHANQRTVAANDALGTRPLYYRRSSDRFRFAFELRALLEPGDQPDPGFLAEAIAGDIVSVDATPYKDVRRVPGGHVAIAQAGSITVRRYWEPPRDVLRESSDTLAERFRETFDYAVRARLSGESVAGVHLSGGLDSSSVLGSVVESRGAQPLALSLALAGEAGEREWILKSASRSHVTPRFIEPPPDLASVALAMSEDTGDLPDMPAGGPLIAALQAAARDAGARVVLSGFGGDQWWTGEIALISDLLRRGRAGDLARWKRAGDRMGQLAWPDGALVRHGVLPVIPQPLRRVVRRVRPAAPPGWIDARFAAQVNLVDRLRHRPDTRDAPSESWRRLRWRIESGEEAIALANLHAAAVQSGAELRHPFYDRQLVELAFRIPPAEHIAAGSDRSVMRRAMAGRLHPDVAARTSKADLTPLLAAALRSPAIAPHLSLETLSSLGWIRPDAAHALVRRVIDRGDLTNATAAWRVLAVEAWLKRHFRAR